MATKKSVAFDPVDIEVGANIKRHRQLCGLSQTELGKALGVSFQQVQKYENGRNRVSASALQKIADILCVPVASLFGHKTADMGTFSRAIPCKKPPRAPEEPQDHDLNVAFSSIGATDVKTQIVALVQAIAKELAERRG